VVVALALGGPFTPPAAAAGGFGFTRVAGPNRFATAAALATTAFPTGAPTAIIATGSNFPDALAADYLAGQEKAPILLVNQAAPVPPETLDALRALHTEHAVLLGLRGAIGDDVRAALALTPSTAPGGANLGVSRIGGQTRYDTMNLIDETPGPNAVGLVDGKPTAIVASGANFADALAAGPLAYERSLPLVLTEPGVLTDQAAQTLQDLDIKQVILIGGTTALPADIGVAINILGISTPVRLGGDDRTQTAALVGDYAVKQFGFDNQHFDLASGDDAFAGVDALALGPLAALQGARPILLLASATQAGPGAAQFIRDNRSTLTANSSNTLAGGQAAAPDATVVAIVNAFNTG
jgi:putative cell wall-binding protein